MSTIKSRREEYSEATRAALLESATSLFAEHGYVQTSLDDVARLTRLTRGAVYHHFNGKQALFEAVVELQEDAMTAAVTAAATTAPDAWHAAMAGLDAFLDFCADPVYSRLVMQEGPVALGWQKWKELEEKHAYGLTESFIKLLIEAGEVEKVPMPTATQIVFGLLYGACRALVEAPPEEKVRVRAECGLILRRILDGLHPSVSVRHAVN